ncbi:hypothetical protein QBC32DRAFT_343338 [Pseudoneurospora amorphoporcata]|uniref:Uncharacterized protein n=1 Tax=Pseudoneurospora amorphoporcata TaxID=241081 RepID=A0AAN6SEV9_9PEZI|nr:hypothetical protein QBC32DRAFT_343338 [Pseudoneurospora amorphoporcata]
MASFLDLSSNWSLHSIPAAFVLALLPNFYVKFAAGKNYDLTNPRKTEEHLAKDASISKPQLNRILRAKAAADNGLETIGLYAAGVVAANAAKMPVDTLNKLSSFYLVSRLVYNFVYIVLQDNRKFAPVRGLVWLAGLGTIFSFFIKAGNALR